MATSDPPRRPRALPWVRGLIGVAAFLLVAEVLSVTGVISRSALPPISTVVGQAALLLGNTQFLGDLAATIEAWAVGLAITVAVGVPAGLDDVDPVAKQTLRAFGFGRFDVIRRVCLPAAAPFIATGIRVASSIALIVSIATGILTGRIDGNGIGAFISDANTAGKINPVLAAALWAGVLGLALNALLLWVERRVLPWHHAYLEESEAAQ